MDIKSKKFHFIAIGGVGMSAIAKFLAQKGAKVSGSDINESKYTDLLRKIGINVHIGHNGDLIQPDMIVTASSAIKSNNPEIIRAKELGVKIYHRSNILKMISDEFSQNKNAYFIGFSGAHGKTTTSGLASYVLEKSNHNPSFIVGGIIPEINTNGNYNGDKFFIAELDESDGTIEKYSTDIAVINNLEEDHLDYYVNGFSDIAKTFNKYLSNKPNQKVVINNDDENNKKFMQIYPSYNYITFGLNNADYTAKNIVFDGLSSTFDVYKNKKLLANIGLSILGKHNVYNALAVIAALSEAGIDINEIKEHFKSFTGMGRRFQKAGEFNQISIYDDYAHHPGEIKTTLQALKTAVKDKNRIIAVFQPHRYSRLKNLWNEFQNAFEYADFVFVTDVYSAGESLIEGINSEFFVKDTNNPKFKYLKGDIKQAVKELREYLKPNDIVVCLGAGNITELSKNILKKESLA